MYVKEGKCTMCPAGYFCNDGINASKCAAGYYCNNGTSKVCANGSYSSQNASSCTKSTTVANCSIYSLTEDACATCKSGYKLSSDKKKCSVTCPSDATCSFESGKTIVKYPTKGLKKKLTAADSGTITVTIISGGQGVPVEILP